VELEERFTHIPNLQTKSAKLQAHYSLRFKLSLQLKHILFAKL